MAVDVGEKKRREEKVKGVFLELLRTSRSAEPAVDGDTETSDDYGYPTYAQMVDVGPHRRGGEEEVKGVLERLEIIDDASFWVKFKEYLALRGGRPECVRKEWELAIEAFCCFQKEENNAFSLARLSSLYYVRREDLLPLPLPWKWLENLVKICDRDRVNKARVAYMDLLEFLEHIVVVHRGRNISSEESASRQGDLQEIKRDLLARHPALSWIM